MSAFRFRLEQVLEWRRKKCRIEEDRLAACLGLLRDTEGKIERLHAERTQVDHELLAQSTLRGADLRNLGRYHLWVETMERELADERRRRAQSTSVQRARVQSAQQDVKLLETMKERKLEEYTALAKRELEALAAEGHLARWSQSRRRSRGRPGQTRQPLGGASPVWNGDPNA